MIACKRCRSKMQQIGSKKCSIELRKIPIQLDLCFFLKLFLLVISSYRTAMKLMMHSHLCSSNIKYATKNYVTPCPNSIIHLFQFVSIAATPAPNIWTPSSPCHDTDEYCIHAHALIQYQIRNAKICKPPLPQSFTNHPALQPLLAAPAPNLNTS